MNINCNCEHCGEPREPLELMGKTIAYQPCSCPAALEEAEKRRLEDQRRQEEAEREARIRRYSQSGVCKRFLNANAECGEYVVEVLAGESLYIDGVVGSGKTYLASSIAKKLIDNGRRVIMLPTVEAMAKIQATYDESGQSAESVIKRFCTCDVLILDDLGKENQSTSGWTESMLFRIINERYAEMRPIIITSQFTTLELIKRLSKNGEEMATAIVSRLVEMSQGVHLENGDRRLQRKKKS